MLQDPVVYIAQTEDDYRPLGELLEGSKALRLDAEENAPLSRWKKTAALLFITIAIEAATAELYHHFELEIDRDRCPNIADQLGMLARRKCVHVLQCDLDLIDLAFAASRDLIRPKKALTWPQTYHMEFSRPVDPSTLLDRVPFWDVYRVLDDERLQQIEDATRRVLDTLWQAAGKKPNRAIEPGIKHYRRSPPTKASKRLPSAALPAAASPGDDGELDARIARPKKSP